MSTKRPTTAGRAATTQSEPRWSRSGPLRRDPGHSERSKMPTKKKPRNLRRPGANFTKTILVGAVLYYYERPCVIRLKLTAVPSSGAKP